MVGATNARVRPSLTEGHITGPRHIRAMKGLCCMGARGQRVYARQRRRTVGAPGRNAGFAHGFLTVGRQTQRRGWARVHFIIYEKSCIIHRTNHYKSKCHPCLPPSTNVHHANVSLSSVSHASPFGIHSLAGIDGPPPHISTYPISMSPLGIDCKRPLNSNSNATLYPCRTHMYLCVMHLPRHFTG